MVRSFCLDSSSILTSITSAAPKTPVASAQPSSPQSHSPPDRVDNLELEAKKLGMRLLKLFVSIFHSSLISRSILEFVLSQKLLTKQGLRDAFKEEKPALLERVYAALQNEKILDVRTHMGTVDCCYRIETYSPGYQVNAANTNLLLMKVEDGLRMANYDLLKRTSLSPSNVL